jgi:4-hydroxy-tetrahydrodipicolinate synthase
MKEERSLMPDMSIISGDDDKTFAMMSDPAIGAGGVISVTSNIAPRGISRMVQAALAGDMEEARNMEVKLKPLLSIVTVRAASQRILPDGRRVTVEDRFRNPIAVKAIMKALGMPAGPCRKPLGRMTQAGVDMVRKTLQQVFSDSPEILAPVGKFYGVDIEARLNDNKVWQDLMYTD